MNNNSAATPPDTIFRQNKNMAGLAALCLVIFGIVYGILYRVPATWSFPVAGCATLVFLYLNLRDIKYIKVSGQAVAFKTYLGRETIYMANDIKEVAFTISITGRSQSKTYKMVVATKDLKEHTFYTDLIKGASGRQLKNKLESMSILVRYEEGLFSA